jgi:hypothetical protein
VVTDQNVTAVGTDTEARDPAMAFERHRLRARTIDAHGDEWLDGPIGGERIAGVEDENE